MNYRVRHLTEYHYSEPVSVSHHGLHLTPRPRPQQNCRTFHLVIDPHPTVLTERTDYFGNITNFCDIHHPHHQLSVMAESEIEIQHPPTYSLATTLPWETARPATLDEYAPSQFLFDSPLVRTAANFADYARQSFTAQRPFLPALLELTERIHQEFTYDPRATTVATPVAEVFQKRRGVCQDFAHLEIACLRSLGLAARYVSGYLQTNPAPDQKKLIGADASHAWLAVYCPVDGWIDVDPTNNSLPTLQHLTIAWGRDYGDVTPIRGVILGGGTHRLQVAVTVEPV